MQVYLTLMQAARVLVSFVSATLSIFQSSASLTCQDSCQVQVRSTMLLSSTEQSCFMLTERLQCQRSPLHCVRVMVVAILLWVASSSVQTLTTHGHQRRLPLWVLAVPFLCFVPRRQRLMRILRHSLQRRKRSTPRCSLIHIRQPSMATLMM